MRLAMLMAGAVLLAGCEAETPDPAPEASRAAARPDVIAPIPEIAWTPKDTQLPMSDQTRGQSEESIRALDRSAASLGTDIAGARQQADAAYRASTPPEPAQQSSAADPAAPAAPTPAPTTQTARPTAPVRAPAPPAPTQPARASAPAAPTQPARASAVPPTPQAPS